VVAKASPRMDLAEFPFEIKRILNGRFMTPGTLDYFIKTQTISTI